jgi:hypothetical protein
VLALSCAFILGILLGIAGTNLLTKEKVCEKCTDCICEKTICNECQKCSDCICGTTNVPEVICNKPSGYDCNPSSLNVNLTKINVRCSDGSVKIWLCQENKWKD